MSSSVPAKSVTEVVAVFDGAMSLQWAIDELLSSGFDRAELSLLASDTVIAEGLGHGFEKVQDLEDDPATPTAAFVSEESIGDAKGAVLGGSVYVAALAAAGAAVASGGTLAGIIIAATLAGGAGGLVGSVLSRLIGDHHAHHLQEQLDRGGILLWVKTRDAAHAQRAGEILAKFTTHEIHTHSAGG